MECEGLENNEQNVSMAATSSTCSENMEQCEQFTTFKGFCGPLLSNNNPEITTKQEGGLSTPEEKQTNRRFSLQPRKTVMKDNCHLRRITKNTFLCNTCFHRHLETIVEEPDLSVNGDIILSSLSKAKRSITFSQFVTKAKLKKRRKKVRKLKEKMEKKLADRKEMLHVESQLCKLEL